ncbi:uncharacterized protein LOC130358105 isoform X2 [Hyla sarda]|uniref:uncharacterized protein LOC130358105 isoform X2 n=1 Tax=Hyla sarda TaxID=327740 RepID=UPI0024C39420|nr:uncharacterized protein LOC130358105 isoform X2 [Hyla sarda]
METLAPAPWRGQVLLCMAVTLSLAMSLVEGDSSSCTPKIDMAGQQNIGTPLGQYLILKCQVRLCRAGLPNVTWCKISGDQCDSVRSGEGIHSAMEEQGEGRAVYVLEFVSIQMNDTGYYQCKAITEDKMQIVGSTVQVVISENVVENVTAVNNTKTDNTTGSTDTFPIFKWLLYIIPSMGGVCILIIIVSLVIYCQKHLKAKQSSSHQEPAPTEELQFVAVPGSPKCKIEGGTQIPMDTYSNIEVTYDNAHLGHKPTTQKDSVTEEEDSIVYADLNYNAKQTGFNFEDNWEVEYATVHLNDKITCNQ